mmetsp:Transcript_38882/g.60573  ORF Transcript_38882/g.60573 Transcript_38882/m.60573 type:complete len:216 (-) Transcript_38882:358-1005(-)
MRSPEVTSIDGCDAFHPATRPAFTSRMSNVRPSWWETSMPSLSSWLDLSRMIVKIRGLIGLKLVEPVRRCEEGSPILCLRLSQELLTAPSSPLTTTSGTNELSGPLPMASRTSVKLLVMWSITESTASPFGGSRRGVYAFGTCFQAICSRPCIGTFSRATDDVCHTVTGVIGIASPTSFTNASARGRLLIFSSFGQVRRLSPSFLNGIAPGFQKS